MYYVCLTVSSTTSKLRCILVKSKLNIGDQSMHSYNLTYNTLSLVVVSDPDYRVGRNERHVYCIFKVLLINLL